MDRRNDGRSGTSRCSSGYRAREWRERGIRARRFLPCPHCGSAVTAKERVWTPPYCGGEAMIFRDARCVNPDCRWAYHRMGGTRDDFVSEVNRRNRG